MRHIKFSSDIDILQRRLPFFLATEEWVARNLQSDDYFFSWQVDPTVICGRNQDIDKEVNLMYCKEQGIDVVRRRSGGGAVMADRDNFMFSFITAGDNVEREFKRYTSLIANALRRLGLNAEATGRNDISINGKKVAGNAFYHIPGRCIAHGTMLYDFNPSHLSNALTPSLAKLESKKVKSVPSRVTSLKNEGIRLSPSEFNDYMISSIVEGTPYVLTAEDVKEIEKIEAGYYLPGFLKIEGYKTDMPNDMDKKNESTHICESRHIEGIGEICVEYDCDVEGKVISLRISGDFFLEANLDIIERKFLGQKINKSLLDEVINTINP